MPSRSAWLALAVTSIAVFMVTLDNLVVTTALPSIRLHLGATLAQLQWFVNAYTLSFAAFLLTGAALGDRFGRRRVFSLGLALFTVSSVAAALAPTANWLVAARAAQGIGGALVMPLSLTLLSEAVGTSRRGLALGLWSGISGLAVALGPVVGGLIVNNASWQWIFWLNVPIGIIGVPLARTMLAESRGADPQLDVAGLLMAGASLVALVWGLVRANELGWTAPVILGAFATAAVVGAAFILHQQRAAHPMVPLRLFRSRQFAATNAVSLVMSFGIFGAIFLLAQFFQTVQHLSPLAAGVRTLPWTAMPMLVAPIAGVASDRIGPRPLLAAGLALQAVAMAWLALVVNPHTPYLQVVAPFALAGVGMGLFFPPVAGAILGAVRPGEQGKASGVNATMREVGGALGVAVLVAVFAANGSYASDGAYTGGMVAAVAVAGVILGVGALIALLVPARGHAAAEFGVAASAPAAG